MVDSDYVYALASGNGDAGNQGLKVVCVNQIMTTGKASIYSVDNSLCGLNSLIDFSSDNQRLTYLRNYD